MTDYYYFMMLKELVHDAKNSARELIAQTNDEEADVIQDYLDGTIKQLQEIKQKISLHVERAQKEGLEEAPESDIIRCMRTHLD